VLERLFTGVKISTYQELRGWFLASHFIDPLLHYLHILFKLVTGNYLITTGVTIIVVISVLAMRLLKIIYKRRNICKDYNNLSISILSITIILVLFEVTFILFQYNSTYLEKKYRFYYVSPYKLLKINRFFQWQSCHDLKTLEYCYPRKINSENLSDNEYAITKKESEFRIIGLGDSFTEGDGADADSTWLKFIERSLKKDSIKKELTFFNAGVCGSDPFFEYILLREKLLKYKPDLVILSINSSDISDIIIRGGFERFQPDGTLKFKSPPWWEPIYASLHISRLLFDNLLRYNELLIKEGELINNASKEKILEAIYSFNNLACEKNFKLLVIFNPMKNEIDVNQSDFDDVIKKIRNTTDIEVLDLLYYYRAPLKTTFFLMPVSSQIYSMVF
jgi:hypothetical protein